MILEQRHTINHISNRYGRRFGVLYAVNVCVCVCVCELERRVHASTWIQRFGINMLIWNKSVRPETEIASTKVLCSIYTLRHHNCFIHEPTAMFVPSAISLGFRLVHRVFHLRKISVGISSSRRLSLLFLRYLLLLRGLFRRAFFSAMNFCSVVFPTLNKANTTIFRYANFRR